MANWYAKIGVTAKFAEDSDYSDPRVDLDIEPYEINGPDVHVHAVVDVATGAVPSTNGTTLTTSHMGSGWLFIIKNLDPTNYVDVKWASAAQTAAGGTYNYVRLSASAFDGDAGAIVVITDLTVGSDIRMFANSVAVKVEVLVLGN